MKIKIQGSGTMPLYANSGMRRVQKGVTITVNAEELAFLKRAKVRYTTEK